MKEKAKRSVLAVFLQVLAGILATSPAWALNSSARWSSLTCAVREDTPRTFPDTQACYLTKDIVASTQVAYRIDFDLPYATYSSTTTYADNKPWAYMLESQYIVHDESGHQVPNPYQPGHIVDTPRSQRKVTIFVTPDYDSCVSQHQDNCLATNSNPAAPGNLIFQRVYYTKRKYPETRQPFNAEDHYDRLGYTHPDNITCVAPSSLSQEEVWAASGVRASSRICADCP